jgi:hypothetical protein
MISQRIDTETALAKVQEVSCGGSYITAACGGPLRFSTLSTMGSLFQIAMDRRPWVFFDQAGQIGVDYGERQVISTDVYRGRTDVEMFVGNDGSLTRAIFERFETSVSR